METIINKAIEGGYKTSVDVHEHVSWWNDIFLDPLFWQALGKACRWEGEICLWGCPDCDTGAQYKVAWQYYALRFHEINLVEGWNSAIAYLENLLSEQTVK